MPEKCVAIIGAGPAGLIAARKLLTLTPFKFTIFEKSARVGGLWDRESLIHPEMMTNFCRFTGSFSDFSWESLDLGRPVPIYPQAWMVEKYLQEYSKMIPETCYRFRTTVMRTVKENGRWKVVAITQGNELVDYFDHVIIATGYLSTPKELKCEMDATLKTNPLFPVPILHSTSYRNLEQIIPLANRSDYRRRTVLVIGGSHSGTDISGLIAQQASDARWCPGGNKAFGGVQVVHVGLNAMLPIPGIARDAAAGHVSMYPLEFTLCERSTRDPVPLEFRFGPASVYENQVLLSFYKEVIEGGAAEVDFEERLPANVAFGDKYYPCVQDGRIKPIRGVVRRLERGACSDTITAIVKSAKGEDIIIENVSVVINATGFHSSGGLHFLADEVKQQLEFDATNTRLPAVLNASYMSQNVNVPDIALLGFVPVNWGVIEMQMRAVAYRWMGRPFAEDPKQIAALGDHMRYIQGAIRDGARKEEVPQFLFGDYLGLMEQAAKELGLSKINGKHGDFDGFVCSSRYIGLEESRREALKTIYAVHRLREDIDKNNPLLAWVAFIGLTGRWRSETLGIDGTKIVHQIDAHPRRCTTNNCDLEYVIFIRKTASTGADENHTLIARYTEVDHEISLWAADQAVYLQTGGLVGTTKIGRDASGEVKLAAGLMSFGATFSYHIDFRGSRLDGFTIIRNVRDSSIETLAFRRPAKAIVDSFGTVGE